MVASYDLPLYDPSIKLMVFLSAWIYYSSLFQKDFTSTLSASHQILLALRKKDVRTKTNFDNYHEKSVSIFIHCRLQ